MSCIIGKRSQRASELRIGGEEGGGEIPTEKGRETERAEREYNGHNTEREREASVE